MRSAAAERVWFGTTPLSRFARGVLAPLEAAYGSVVTARNKLYEAGILRVHTPVLPVLSVGNLSVGGTGKTPVSAWLAAQLACRGAAPAVVVRGYGGDEPLVHSTLNPLMPVVVASRRFDGVIRAARLGADVAVLDDAFQHRRLRRTVDVVLVSAEEWRRTRRLLPAGPWRESAMGLRRADLVIVTRKAACLERAGETLAEVDRIAPGVPHAVMHLKLAELHEVVGTGVMPLAALAGTPVLAISAIGDPHSFLRQLTEAGAQVTPATFGDHHSFTPREVKRLATAAEQQVHAICTLKDAVKLAKLWPRQAPRLWYVSQQITLEHGEASVHAILTAVLRARRCQP